MILDAYRRALRARQQEAARVVRVSLLAREEADPSGLRELDVELFSRERWPDRAGELEAGGGPPVQPETRARLALALEIGFSLPARELDHALSKARRDGRVHDAIGIAAERERVLRDAAKRDSQSDLWALAGVARGNDLEALAGEAHRLLEISAGPWTALAGANLERSRMGTRGRVEISPADGGIEAPLTHTGRVERLLSRLGLNDLPLAAGLAGPAIRELGRDLGLDPRGTLEIATVPSPREEMGLQGGPVPRPARRQIEAPIVLEEDPPAAVTLFLPVRGGYGALAEGLGSAARAFLAIARSPALSEELRFCSDRAIAEAVAVLSARLAVEHTAAGRYRPEARRLALAREILGVRLAASLVLARRDLFVLGRATPEEAAVERGALVAPGWHDLPPHEDSFFDPIDRLRGALFAPQLRERLLSRFGNLWYRERVAGRMLREIAEPGGALVLSEAAAGLSLGPGGAEELTELWRDEERGCR